MARLSAAHGHAMVACHFPSTGTCLLASIGGTKVLIGVPGPDSISFAALSDYRARCRSRRVSAHGQKKDVPCCEDRERVGPGYAFLRDVVRPKRARRGVPAFIYLEGIPEMKRDLGLGTLKVL